MSTGFNVDMPAPRGGEAPLSPLQGTLVALQRRGISLPADLDRLVTSSNSNFNNRGNGKRSEIGRPPVSGVSLLLAILCFGSGIILLFIAQLFSGTLPAFVIPAIHHGWSQDVKSRSCRRAALAYFVLGALILFWGVVVGWCRWRLCVLLGLRVDRVGKRMLGHRRYYQLRGRNVPSSSSASPTSNNTNNYYDSDDDDADEERGMLLSSSTVDIEMSHNGGDDHGVVRRRGGGQLSSVASGTTTTTSYRGGMRASPTSPITSTPGTRRNNNATSNNDVGFVKRILGKILLPTTPSAQSDSRSRGRGPRGGIAASSSGAGDGIYVNQAIRDTLDPIWMSDSFLKQLVKSR